MRTLRRHAGEEQGAVAVLYAILLVVMLGLVALTIDLGTLRYDRRASQTLADLSSLAGAMKLDPTAAGSPSQACLAAWQYFLTNSGLTGTGDPCGSFPTTMPSACPTTATVGTATVGDYQVTITWPVLDGDPLMDSRTAETWDGTNACERIGTRIVRTRGYLFASALGAGLTSGATGASAVARGVVGENDKQVANLMLLDKTGCDSLKASGGGGVRVVAAQLDDGTWNPGIIHADSSGSACGGSGYVVNRSGGGSIIAEGNDSSPPAPGTINLFAQPTGATTCQNHACNPADILSTYSLTTPGVWPQPTNLPKQTNRTPADHTYNCKSSYSSLDGTAPGNTNWNVPGCGDSTAPYIDNLRSALGSATTNPSSWNAVSNPNGFKSYKAFDPACGTANITVPVGNWYVDCAFKVSAPVTFLGGNIIFQNDVTVSNGGTLSINSTNATATLPTGCLTSVCTKDSSAKAAIVYFADGASLKQSNGALNLNSSFVYLYNGAVTITGGSFTWIAPTEGPFTNLALWSDRKPLNNTPDTNSLEGQGTVVMEGVYFTPNSLTKIAGGGGSTPKKAQFFTWDLNVTGGGSLLLKPDPKRALKVPTFAGVRLIR